MIKNALDHTKKGGKVRLFWEQSSAMVRILVEDDGSGIMPEDKYHIFKRFYRSKNSKDTGGVGLGLPLAKSIVEGQGGILTMDSVPGKGSIFILSFLSNL
ncbi:MAG: sensor histidine kinase [Ruminococcus sp.]